VNLIHQRAEVVAVDPLDELHDGVRQQRAIVGVHGRLFRRPAVLWDIVVVELHRELLHLERHDLLVGGDAAQRVRRGLDEGTARRVRREPGRSGGCPRAPRSRRGFGARGVQADGRSLALERCGWSLLEVVAVMAEVAQRGFCDEDVVAGHSRRGLDAGCCVDRISDHREVAPPTPADRADDDAARVDAHSDPEPAA
jgi:hypothetical protein